MSYCYNKRKGAIKKIKRTGQADRTDFGIYEIFNNWNKGAGYHCMEKFIIKFGKVDTKLIYADAGQDNIR